jgi:hypothetical protein
MISRKQKIIMSQKNTHWTLPAAIALGLFASNGRAIAQSAPPFYGGPVTVFDVEIGIIDSGTLLDAQAVVSQDRRYVTINARPTNTGLLALQDFQTQQISTAAAGFVGGVNPGGIAQPPTGHTLPSEIDRAARDAASVLNRRGVYLIAPLK